MPRSLLAIAALLILFVSCATPGPATRPNEKEWNVIVADYQWLNTLRTSQKQPAANAPRKAQLEQLIENHNKIEPTYVAFVEKLREYYERTGDTRAGVLLAREKVNLGDEYMNVLSRYDRAIEQYRLALQYDPSNPDAQKRLDDAEKRRFVALEAFSTVKTGMKEEDVRRAIGLPREDWIKQVVQKNRVYAVWIYPKQDGGAAAVYFDNGSVYHTNWNAAAPPGK
jgi:tetratricopeptide (TPR) repeat protein